MRNTSSEDLRSAALARLPKNHATHWVARRKAQVVQAVQRGWLSLDEACARYRLSLDEFLDWQRTLRVAGVDGLKLTHSPAGHRRRRRTAGSGR